MRKYLLTAAAALALGGSAPAWAACSAYTTGGCNNGTTSQGGQQWGQTYNGFGGGEQHRCVEHCDQSGRNCTVHCY
jgi:hypothetical protein